MSELEKAALNYASLGWYIFPIVSGQKNPLTKHGVKDATNVVHTIRIWWEKWPNANIGLACGVKSGVYVIDIDLDKEKGINGYKTYEKTFPDSLPKTVCQNTPRGGFHVFYKTKKPPANKNNWYTGIDIRGDGYYVLLPPSIHPNRGIYSWSVGCEPWSLPLAEYPDWMRPEIPPLDKSKCSQSGIVRVAREISASDRIKRASFYLSECDPAIQGLGGHDKLLWASVAMVHGFLLSDGETLAILSGEYNPRCIPEWDLSQSGDRKDFERKIKEARKLTPKFPKGWLLNDPAYATPIESSLKVSEGALKMIRDFQEKKIKPEYIGPVTLTTPNNFRSELEYFQNPPGLVGDICKWINKTALKKQPFITLACTLTFCGSLFGRKVRDYLGSRTNLYCMGIILSSGGKAHAPNQIRKLCEHAGCLDLLGGDEAASDAAIECRLERNPSTLFLWDEIGLLLSYIQSGSNPHLTRIVSLLMKLYSLAGTVYKGREYASDDKQRTIVQPCCCIYGTSTPSRFLEGITLDELQDGWLSRCLVFESDENPPKTRENYSEQVPSDISDLVNLWYFREINTTSGKGDIESFTAFQSRTGTALAKPPEQMIIATTKDAEHRFINFDNESIEIGKENPDLACLWAKTEENARKISIIIAAGTDFEKPIITGPIAEYSCRLIKYILTQFVNKTVPKIVSSKVDMNKQKILEIVKKSGIRGCLNRDITRSARWSTRKQRNELLGDLIESGEIITAPGPGGKGILFWTYENFQKITQ